MRERTWKWLSCIGAWACLTAVLSVASSPDRISVNLGPYNATFLEGGIGVARPLSAEANVAGAGRPWSMTGWIRWSRPLSGQFVVAAVGNSNAQHHPQLARPGYRRCLLRSGRRIRLAGAE